MDPFQGTEPTEDELALVAQSYALRQVYWPSYTWQIQTQHLNKLDEKRQSLEARGIDFDLFGKHKTDLFNKINASFYHLEKLKENENTIIELGKKMAEASKKHTPNGVLGIVGTPYEPIEYEYEALLVTLKGGLDISAMILAQPAELHEAIALAIYYYNNKRIHTALKMSPATYAATLNLGKDNVFRKMVA